MPLSLCVNQLPPRRNESVSTRLERRMRQEEAQLRRARSLLEKEKVVIEQRTQELGHTTSKFRQELGEIARVSFAGFL